MDVIIPAHNLKTVSSALSTLSKVGKYLYIEFDPLAGLTFRTLNDGKSSFAQFHFDVGFFERCSSPPDAKLHRRVVAPTNTSGNGSSSTQTQTQTQTLTASRMGARTNRRKRGRTSQTTQTQEDELNDEKYLCRVLIRTISSLLRQRKGLQSLRIRSIGLSQNQNPDDPRSGNGNGNSDGHVNGSDDGSEDDDTNRGMDQSTNLDEEEPNTDNDPRMQLSFEFRIQSEGIMRITHKVGVSETESVVAEASRINCLSYSDVDLTKLGFRNYVASCILKNRILPVA
jgi:hypothetical protein